MWKKAFRRFFPLLIIVFTMIPYVATASPYTNTEISSGFTSNQVTVENLAKVPKVTSKYIDKQGKEIPLVTKTNHKLLSKKTVNGVTELTGQTDIGVKININTEQKPSVAQRMLANTAYANSGSGSDTQASWVTQHFTAYWTYYISNSVSYYTVNHMTGYWTRGYNTGLRK